MTSTQEIDCIEQNSVRNVHIYSPNACNTFDRDNPCVPNARNLPFWLIHHYWIRCYTKAIFASFPLTLQKCALKVISKTRGDLLLIIYDTKICCSYHVDKVVNNTYLSLSKFNSSRWEVIYVHQTYNAAKNPFRRRIYRLRLGFKVTYWTKLRSSHFEEAASGENMLQK